MIAKSRVLALSLLLLPQLALALGLGDIRLNSRLNAPLDAEIELLGATPDELATLKPQLASRETFARYALEWPAFLSSVTVTQEHTADGRNLLRLRSQEPVTEPFVTLLVEVNWARGRLVREYTVLIDPPVFAPGPAVASEPVAAPGVGVSRQGEIARPAAAPPPPSPAEAAPVRSAVAAAPGGSYTVRRGDTLTSIASRLAGGADTQRMMLGLYQGNPDAFAGNMSEMRSGAVLRVPDAEALAAIGSREAAAEVRRQYAAWSGHSGTRTTEPERLRLVPPGEAGAGAGTGGPDAAAAANAAELTARVRDLESQLSEAQAQLEVRNRELADLQRRLAEASSAPAPAPVEAPAPMPAPAGAEVAEGDEVSAESVQPPAVSTEPPAAVGEEAAGEPEAPPAATPTVSAPAPAPGTSIFDTLRAFWYIPALLIALLLALFGYRKWKAGRVEDFDHSLGRLAEEGAAVAERRSGLTDTARLRKPVGDHDEEAFLVEESGSHERPRLEESGSFRRPPAVVTTAAADQTISGETAINLDQGDPLAEADFHMAYGLYDQAADLVRIAIQREPARRDLKLKLLEVFFVWGNKDQFLTAARELAASRADAPAGEWDKIVIMGKQLAPEDELFQQGTSAGGAIAGGIDLDLEGGQNRVDYDLLGDPGGESPRAGVDLDFSTALGDAGATDLDLGDKDPTGEAGTLTTVAGEDLDFVLDDPSHGADRSGNTTREMTAQMPGDATSTYERTALLPDAMDAPTVEQPALRGGDDHTIRQKLDVATRHGGAEQTAELAIDDLGLDPGALDGDSHASSDAPTMVAGLDARSRAIIEDAERRAGGDDGETGEAASTGSWYTIGSTDQTGTNPVIADVNATASLKALPDMQGGSETSRLAALKSEVDVDFSATDAFGTSTTRNGLDLDVGASGGEADGVFAATQKIGPEDLALPDLEPVTMSEVGTKLDLARAYMDMGDPDGARSILKEVLQEGSVSQKQEAQRLIDTLPG